MRLGLIGVGRIGQMHAQNLASIRDSLAFRDEGLEVVIADVLLEAARRVADLHGFVCAESVEQLWAHRLDGVIIATGTATHPVLIRHALAHGVPVLCEKPVAESVEASLPILREIEASGVPVQIGHQRRFDTGYLEARRLFQSGELGWIHSLRAVTADMFPPPVEFLAGSGGLFRDCSVHDFDIIRWLTGQEIVSVYAQGSNRGDPRIGEVGDVDTALALITLADGTLGTVSATRYNGFGHDVRLEVQGSQRSVLVGLDSATALRSTEAGVDFPAGERHTTFAERFHAAYLHELVAFTELIRNARENPCTAREAIAASVTADAAQESLATGRAVRVPSLAELLA